MGAYRCSHETHCRTRGVSNSQHWQNQKIAGWAEKCTYAQVPEELMESESVALGQVHCLEDARLTNVGEGLSEGRNEMPLAMGRQCRCRCRRTGGCWSGGDVAGERMK